MWYDLPVLIALILIAVSVIGLFFGLGYDRGTKELEVIMKDRDKTIIDGIRLYVKERLKNKSDTKSRYHEADLMNIMILTGIQSDLDELKINQCDCIKLGQFQKCKKCYGFVFVPGGELEEIK